MKLSEQDKELLERDKLWFGMAFIRTLPDGSNERIDPLIVKREIRDGKEYLIIPSKDAVEEIYNANKNPKRYYENI